MYATEGELQKALNAAIKLTTYHHRWYMDSAYPSLVASWIYKLGLEHGHAKIQYTLLSMVRFCFCARIAGGRYRCTKQGQDGMVVLIPPSCTHGED
jgi:hypothetical protein